MLALFALVGGAWAIDGAVNGSRIYDGVSVGAVDVSGMTEEEARRAVSSFYKPRVADGRALIFASEEARDTLDVESELAEQDAQAEQLSLEEARANKQVWVAESGTLGARLPVNEAVSRAFAVGREGGLAERMEAARNGVSVDVALSFDEEAPGGAVHSIDESAGEPRLSITASPSRRARYRSPRATAARPSTAPRWPVSSPRAFSARRPARSSSWRRPAEATHRRR